MFPVNAQVTYENFLTESSENFKNKSFNGYSTFFDFSREEVRRGWWEYAKKFGNPINMKTYYQVKVSSAYTDGNVDLMLYSKTEASDGGVSFFLGIEESDFNNQLKNLLVDFKKEFYIKKILERIEAAQKEAAKQSDDYRSTFLSDERGVILNSLSKIIRSVDSLRNEIKEVITN